MQRFDSPVHYLGESCHLRHFPHGDRFAGKKPGGAARGEDLHTQVHEAARELHHSALVEDAD